MSEEPPLQRIARLEADIANLKEESRAIRGSLHDLIRTALADHSAAIARLAAAHDQRLGVWWSLVWIGAALAIVVGGIAWLVEHQIQIVIKP